MATRFVYDPFSKTKIDVINQHILKYLLFLSYHYGGFERGECEIIRLLFVYILIFMLSEIGKKSITEISQLEK